MEYLEDINDCWEMERCCNSVVTGKISNIPVKSPHPLLLLAVPMKLVGSPEVKERKEKRGISLEDRVTVEVC